MTGQCCCCDSVVVELCCCGCEAGGGGWPRPSHHLVCGRRRERERTTDSYTDTLSGPGEASHWSRSACCGLSLARSVMSVCICEGLSLGPGLCCPLGPVSTLRWTPVSLQRKLRRGAVTMMLPFIRFCLKLLFKIFNNLNFPFFIHILIISCYRY